MLTWFLRMIGVAVCKLYLVSKLLSEVAYTYLDLYVEKTRGKEPPVNLIICTIEQTLIVNKLMMCGCQNCNVCRTLEHIDFLRIARIN
jgi:hypothetical protein